MNREDIIRMARQAGSLIELAQEKDLVWLASFAKLVAQHTLSNIDPSKFMSYQEGMEAGRLAEREACAELVWPKLKVWSEEEQTAMGLAFNRAQEKHGWYETLMAVGASVLKIKAEAIRARGQA